jgi:hypothetical protein
VEPFHPAFLPNYPAVDLFYPAVEPFHPAFLSFYPAVDLFYPAVEPFRPVAEYIPKRAPDVTAGMPTFCPSSKSRIHFTSNVTKIASVTLRLFLRRFFGIDVLTYMVNA